MIGKKITSKGASKLWLPFILCSCCYILFTQLQLVFTEAAAFHGAACAKLHISTNNFIHTYTEFAAQLIFTVLNQGPVKYAKHCGTGIVVSQVSQVSQSYQLTWIHCYIHVTLSTGVFPINDDFEFIQTNSKLEGNTKNC